MWPLGSHLATNLITLKTPLWAVWVIARYVFSRNHGLPSSSAIARIDDPEALFGKKFRQGLLARNRRHPVAQDDHPLGFAGTRWRQEFRYDSLPESRSEHRSSTLISHGICPDSFISSFSSSQRGATAILPRSCVAMAAAIAWEARALGCRSQGRRHDESISTKT